MSGGPSNSGDPGQHVWLRSGSIVTPEEYRRNQQQLIQYRDTLARMEQENEQAYLRYTMAEQELENRVAQGREAELMLSNIRSRSQAQITTTPLLTMASSAANGTSSIYSPAPTHTPAYGSRAANEHNGEFMQGNSSRTASGATQPHAYTPYYNPSSTQHARPPPPPYNIQHQTAQQHQAHTSAFHDPYRYAATQQPSPYSAAAPANHSQYDPSQYPPQQYQAHHPQGYSAAIPPAGPPPKSTSRNDEARRQGPNQAAPSAERPASRSSTGSNKQTPRQVSASVQSSNVGQSQEGRKAIIEELQKRAVAAEERIHGIIRELPGQTAMMIFRIIIDKLKHKMKKTDGSSVPLPSLEHVKNSITPQMDHAADLVVAELQNLPGSLIINILHKVQARIGQKTNNTEPPVTVMGQQSTSVVDAPPAQHAEPSVPPVPLETQAQPRQPYAIRPPQVNWPIHAQPSHQPQPLHEDLQVRQQLPNGTAGPKASEPTLTNSTPSVSFSNLPPSTPRPPQTTQPNVVGPTFTPGRLAHDILRSLGRPTGQTAAGISSLAPSKARADGNQANGKRKRSISTEEDNDKRHKPSSDAAADSTAFQNTGNLQMLATPSAPPVSIDASKPPEAVILHQELSVSQDESMAVVEEPEEIHTPGVIESALNEAAAALRRSHTSTYVQQLSSPMRDAPPVHNGLISSSSPGPPSAASPPPSSKVTTPEPEVPPQLDGDVEMVVPATPVAGPSKQPLFYVSPTASPNEEHPRPHFDDAMSEFVPSGLLTGSAPTSPRKGKGRAREDDAEVEIVEAALTGGNPGDTDSDVVVVDTSEPGDVEMVKRKRKAPATTKTQRVYVLVPPPSQALKKLRREQHSRGGVRVVGRAVVSSDEDSDVDEIAEDFRDEATQVKEGMSQP
ncbi:hypothetical protein PHLGIDRAFT_241011 [Phlebiopsis gigantea 11061_1 CR5-6]|uniref:Uncharacterized protein n=1 Tax=Phlebiopsis gigantea (strain 11061_1 CR5-6) TaxID=745531 RepID=A0A0C3SBX4_PHLG1|nr:hypothetical protein PHLGIDRAFT_241011 [Phlebiopsis gigantea 11061_1 CR5-6]